MRMFTILAASTMAFVVATPALAQDAMMKDGMRSGAMPRMSAAETRQMNNCKAMSHRRMMRNATCRRMMRMHPEMMSGNGMHDGAAMQGDTMMKSGH